MEENEIKKTNIAAKIDSEAWDRLMGLAKFEKVHVHVLLEEAIKDRLKKGAKKK